jgi:archaemetzincin
VDTSVLEKIKDELCEIYPKTECFVLKDTMSVPAGAYEEKRRQFHSTHILAKMNESFRQIQADRLLGVTEVDLYVPRLNFVFGEAMYPGKAAIISLFRLRPEFYGHRASAQIFLDRCVKEAVHEIGHTLGLRHCKNPYCVMFFSNSILDTDRKEKTFCQKCHSRVARLLEV